MTCKDCDPGTTRPAPFPGPRCHTHNEAIKKIRSKHRHETEVGHKYGLLPGEYEALLAYQNGRCWICQRATGKTKRLAVDHNHRTGEPRGLLCGPCNRGVVGHLREDPDAFYRVIYYLFDPPARRVLGRMRKM